jgi:hypothetical protein
VHHAESIGPQLVQLRATSGVERQPKRAAGAQVAAGGCFSRKAQTVRDLGGSAAFA